MPGDEALSFAERLPALLDATRYSATYKLATLLAFIDVASERTAPDGSAPTVLSGKEVARRVIELYWPQTIPMVRKTVVSHVFSRKQRRTICRPSSRHGRPHALAVRRARLHHVVLARASAVALTLVARAGIFAARVPTDWRDV